MKMPNLSPTMTVGTVAAWNVKVGDKVKPGDSLCMIDTDKSSVAYETTEEGFVAKILVPSGTADVPLGQPLCILVEDAADVAAFANYAAPASAAAAPKPAAAQTPAAPKQAAAPAVAPTPTPTSTPAAAPAPAADGRVAASRAAKATAEKLGVPLASVPGTGPNGRIIAADVNEFKAAPQPAAIGKPQTAVSAPAAGSYEDVPLTNIRKIIARRLTESMQQIPHFYLTSECQIDALLEIRALLNKTSKTKISVNDLVVKASAGALRAVPQVNSSWFDTFIRRHNTVDICVAVSTDTGLITPIVHDADLLGLSQIAATTKDLADRARAGKLAAEEYQGGTFTISNLGMFGIDQFTAIINPPQAAILAVGAGREKVVRKVSPDGTPKYDVATVMRVTLSCDHRVVDGAVGAQWLQAFRDRVENPITMLL